MSWEQDLVNAQVEVNRIVFEMNREKTQDKKYIITHAKEAIKDLNEALEKLT